MMMENSGFAVRCLACGRTIYIQEAKDLNKKGVINLRCEAEERGDTGDIEIHCDCGSSIVKYH